MVFKQHKKTRSLAYHCQLRSAHTHERKSSNKTSKGHHKYAQSPVWIIFDPTCPAGSEAHQKIPPTKEISSNKVKSIFSVSKVTVVLTSKVPSLNDPNLMVGETATTNEALKLQKDWSRKFCVQEASCCCTSGSKSSSSNSSSSQAAAKQLGHPGVLLWHPGFLPRHPDTLALNSPEISGADWNPKALKMLLGSKNG